MVWTSHPEHVARCSTPPGPVASDETVARLLHSNIAEPDHDPLSLREMLPPKKAPVSNACGDSDGCSLDRAGGLADDELRQRAQAQAQRRPGRASKGAMLARVEDLRAIRMDGAPGQQVIFVYDDPMGNNAQHAILRMMDSLPRPDQQDLRDKVRRAFNLREVAA